jgi:putative flippase GtrA
VSQANTRKQFARYALTGLASNLFLYLVYLALTTGGMDPKSSMSLLYALGVAQTFLFNKRWAFRHDGMHGPAFARYCISYGLGYAINLLVLILLVDRMGFPHQLVQGVMVLTLAVMLFLLQKFWVFRTTATPSSSMPLT